MSRKYYIKLAGEHRYSQWLCVLAYMCLVSGLTLLLLLLIFSFFAKIEDISTIFGATISFLMAWPMVKGFELIVYESEEELIKNNDA